LPIYKGKKTLHEEILYFSLSIRSQQYFKRKKNILPYPFNEVSSIDWNVTLPQNNNVNDIFNSFLYCKISEVIENHAPLKKLSRQDARFSLKPWLTSAIKVSIKQKIDYIGNS
jgi:hypothetical protein